MRILTEDKITISTTDVNGAWEDLLFKNGKCCICDRPLSTSKYINFMQLDKKAKWQHPAWGNILIPEARNRALAVICDDCLEAGEKSGVSGMIKYALQVSGNQISYHDVDELEDTKPITEDDLLPWNFSQEIPIYGPNLKPDSKPVYWMNETSGKLRTIIEKFLKDVDLNQPELKTLRWYVYQWVKGMPKKPHGYESILKMSQLELKKYCYTTLLDYNIDPF